MALVSWMYADPAAVAERLEELRHQEAARLERERKRKARRIRKLTKLAKARELRGQR
jgi:hypothetical protein